MVPDPGPDWPSVVACLIDGIDMVVVAAPARIPDSVTRALMAPSQAEGLRADSDRGVDWV